MLAPFGRQHMFFSITLLRPCTGAPRRLAGGTPASWGWNPAPGAAQRAANAAERLRRPPAARRLAAPGRAFLLSAGAIFFYIYVLKASFTRSIIGHYIP